MTTINLAESNVHGRLQGARAVLYRLGIERFGAVDDQVRVIINAINSVEELEHLAVGVYDVESWDALLEEAPFI